MHLKSVSLYGFKTFAQKTDFTLKPGITAIVGPNGCGKSNLFDALVWVLGEQSVRSIRGYKMEDVIFHGSSSKKPLGFAQVALTFDNEGQYFPLPHSEVSICRRFYKSGEGEFEINGQLCRLRDIQNLLMDTGMGKLNYSIINQGDIEYVIGLSPTERRTIFDEAAGINKYKAEKRKTLQKIKDTDANLARLRDLLTEIEERLGPLAEQSEKARRYEELTERIENLKLRVIVSDIKRITASIAENTSQEEAARDEIQKSEESISTARDARENLRAGLASAHAAVSEEGQSLGRLSGTLSHHEESLRLLQNSIQQATLAKDRTASEIASAARRTGELAGEISGLEKKKESNSAEIEKLKKELNAALPSETASFDSELEHERKLREKTTADKLELDTTRDRLETLRSEFRQSSSRLASFAEQKEEKRKEIQRAEKQIEQINERSKKKSAELELIEHDKKKSSEKIESFKTQASALSEKVTSLRRTLEAERENLSYQRARGEYLSALTKASESQSAEPGKWLSLKDSEPLPINLKIAKGFEPAVRRALGPALNAFITPEGSYIEKITPRQAGEMLFMVAGLIKSSKPDASLLKSDGVVGLLSDFAEADGPEKDVTGPALKALLSHFVIVENSTKLAELAKKHGQSVSLVSKTGDAVLAGGILTLGEGLGGREDLKELAAQVRDEADKSRAAVARLEKELSENGGKLTSLNREISALESGAHKHAIRNVELSSELSSLNNEKAIHEKAIEQASESLKKLDESCSSFDAEKKKSEEELISLEALLAEKKKEYESTEKLLNDLLESRRASQALLQDLRLKINNLSKENEGIAENIVYRNQDIERINERKAQLEKEVAALEQEATHRSTEYETAQTQGKEMAAQVVAARQALAKKQENIQSLEQNISAAGKEITAAENAAAELREKLLQLQMKHARLDAQLEDARRVFSEEYPDMEEADALEKAGQPAPGEKSEYKQLKDERESLGPVNMLAIGEYEDEKSRFDLLYAQITDVEETRSTLLDMVNKYDDLSRDQFLETFNRINEKFKETFDEVFTGGTCEISLTDANNPLECGVEIAVQIPSKRMRNIHLLSGGEKALCALTLIFAILKVKPSPFYLLDEVDAGLDEENVDKFKKMLRKYSREVQFLVITHNKGTIVGADHYYGITMQEGDGYTRVLSVSLENKNA